MLAGVGCIELSLRDPAGLWLVVTLLFYLCFQMSLLLHFVGDVEI